MRRLFAPTITPGATPLDAEQSHHARVVLRLGEGDEVELFDQAGMVARGVIRELTPLVVVDVTHIEAAIAIQQIVVASAVPKGDRADWMVEKLSELGVARFVPLRTARSVVHPEGAKLDRWRRIGTESAKQCKRAGLMQIDSLTPLGAFVESVDPAGALFMSIGAASALRSAIRSGPMSLLIGPEGGWTEDEEQMMRARGLTPSRLGRTILRIETAAVVAAGMVLASDVPA